MSTVARPDEREYFFDGDFYLTHLALGLRG